MRRWLETMIVALSAAIAFAGGAGAAETEAGSKFMGVFKGSYRGTFPQAVVTKRFLITNGAYAVNPKNAGDEDTVQKMSEKIIKDFILKGSGSCKSKYYVVEEVATQLAYSPDGALLLHSDANVVCFNTKSGLLVK